MRGMSYARLGFMADLYIRAELEAEKHRKFHSLVRHANANSPYYANLIRERHQITRPRRGVPGSGLGLPSGQR